MGGKAALIFVIGFIIIFSYYHYKLSVMTVDAAENYNVNYVEALVHEAAVSAMNIAVNKVWDTGIAYDTFSVVAQGCTAHVKIDTLTKDTVRVRSKAWSRVFEKNAWAEFGVPKKVEDSLFALFTGEIPGNRYMYWSNQETGMNWIDGDTVYGPLHTNGVIRTIGSPVFFGKVTAGKGISPNPKGGGSRAQFLGGWEIGITAIMQTDMTNLVNKAVATNGLNPVNSMCVYNTPYMFDFLPNGDVVRWDMTDPAVPDSVDTVPLVSIAPTGVIYSTADFYLKGTLNGALTMYTLDNVWIQDDIVYADDPLINHGSDDMLGIVANNDIIITDNPANDMDCTVHACMLSLHGTFGAQNPQTRPDSGTLTVVGSVGMDKEGQVGTWSVSVFHGFHKMYYFDDRFFDMYPPNFPFVWVWTLIAWWE